MSKTKKAPQPETQGTGRTKIVLFAMPSVSDCGASVSRSAPSIGLIYHGLSFLVKRFSKNISFYFRYTEGFKPLS
jgi:hypothetical protein